MNIADKILSYPHLRIKTLDRDFPLTINGETIYINPHRLTRGNSKLHKVWIFDLPSGSPENGGTCLNCKSCERDCYSNHQEKQYKYVRPFRLINLYLMTEMPLVLREMIDSQIATSYRPFTTFRIHAAGDFFSPMEISFWSVIVKSHPNIKFYAYTKVDHLFDFSPLTNNSNFNLISSMIEDNGNFYRNFGSLDYIKGIAEKTGGFICPATMLETKKTTKCNKTCSYCITGKKPLFLIHGKGRNNVRKNLKKSA